MKQECSLRGVRCVSFVSFVILLRQAVFGERKAHNEPRRTQRRESSRHSFAPVIAAVIAASFFLSSSRSWASPPDAFHLLLAPGTLSQSSATFLWDKQTNGAVYQLWLNGKLAGSTTKTNYTLNGLSPASLCVVKVRVKEGAASAAIKFTTSPKSKVFNVLDYGARDDTAFKNTTAIQAAINACTAGGTVYIPNGTFVSGALFLKSNMTLWIEKGGVLKGSAEVKDYEPMYLNRFEGWEMKTYASLVNAGTLNRNGTYHVKNLRITGGGTISGGGKKLGDAMIKAAGLRSRGRLILLMNAQNVCLSNLTVTEPPCWTIHYLYSNNLTCDNLTIVTKGIRNGDGIDPDSSTDSYLFNCTFDTGDDCIAIKSGKNPEGFFVASLPPTFALPIAISFGATASPSAAKCRAA